MITTDRDPKKLSRGKRIVVTTATGGLAIAGGFGIASCSKAEAGSTVQSVGNGAAKGGEFVVKTEKSAADAVVKPDGSPPAYQKDIWVVSLGSLTDQKIEIHTIPFEKPGDYRVVDIFPSGRGDGSDDTNFTSIHANPPPKPLAQFGLTSANKHPLSISNISPLEASTSKYTLISNSNLENLKVGTPLGIVAGKELYWEGAGTNSNGTAFMKLGLGPPLPAPK